MVDQTDSPLLATPAEDVVFTGMIKDGAKVRIEKLGWPGEGTKLLTARLPGDDDELPLCRLRYGGYANSVLWPLFHEQLHAMEYRETFKTAYHDVNAYFADDGVHTPLQQPGGVALDAVREAELHGDIRPGIDDLFEAWLTVAPVLADAQDYVDSEFDLHLSNISVSDPGAPTPRVWAS